MVEKELSLSNAALVELMHATFAKGSSFRFQVKGFSMLPFIRSGDVLTISPVSSYSISVGDLVAFIHPQNKNLIIHRLIRKRDTSYIIKGDNVYKPDSLIREDNILGYVSGAERNNKKILLGFGPERFLIAFLSRINLFCLLVSAHRIARQALRRFAR